MVKQHYYPIFLLLGILFTAPLHAAHCDNNQAAQDGLTSLNPEKDQVNLEELKQGLIDFSRRIKAKDKRKVYFFIGAAEAGKSLSIQALQGNKIKKVKEETSDDSEDELFASLNNKKKSLPSAQFEIVKYVHPKHQVPMVGDSGKGAANSTSIYYPDPKKPQYKGIAFVETSLADITSFFWSRKPTNAAAYLSVTSFFYATKANRIGGLVLVISALELDQMKGKVALMCFADLLASYFGKTLDNKAIRKSFLVMITKVDEMHSSSKASEKLRKVIQSAYAVYYTNPNNDENRRLKLFFEMLLRQDVPKDKINNSNNFTLDADRYCFVFPWKQTIMQHILDKKLTKLNPIAANDLCPFDNPISQYMQGRIVEISFQLNQAIKPLLTLKSKLGRMSEQLERRKNTQEIDPDLKEAEQKIDDMRRQKILMENDNALEIVFSGSHDERLPLQNISNVNNQPRGYKLCKAFEYAGEEPIYAIWASHSPKAELSESNPFSNSSRRASDKFIEKHFMITKNTSSKGSTWQAITKNGSGVVKEDKWVLYHITEGLHKVQCNIEFYSLTKERIATKKKIAHLQKKIENLERSLAVYIEEEKKCYNRLAFAYKTEVKKWQAQCTVQLTAWESTADMLQFFKDEILTNHFDKKFITAHLANFEEATHLQPYFPALEAKEDHQQNELQLEPINRTFLYGNVFPIGAGNDRLNDHQFIDGDIIEEKEEDILYDKEDITDAKNIMDID